MPESMDAQDDPFEYSASPEVGVGFSDRALLWVSVVGFGALSLIVYCIIIARVKSTEEVEKLGADDELNYEEELLRSDVTKLNRAQRRARAKALMKRQRRAEGGDDVAQHNNDDDNDDNDNNNNNSNNDNDHPLSRKERQKAAKEMEKKERHLLDAQRQEEQRRAQEAAKEEKKKRLQLEAERTREEKARREQEKKQKEMEAFDRWNFFFGTTTVQEWTEELKEQRIVSIDKLAERFGVTASQVENRIRGLIEAGRVTGVLDGGRFITFTHEDLKALASFVRDQGMLSLQDLSNAAQTKIVF